MHLVSVKPHPNTIIIMSDKYIDKIIELYTKTKVNRSSKEKFHDWLIEDEFSEEKEDALYRLWKQADPAQTEEKEKKRHTLNFRKYAAALVLIAASACLFLIIRKSSESEVVYKEHFSQAGMIDTISLPDGSTVYTNSRTIIIYPETFGKKTRTVYLSGEACFKVTKNKKIPFIVQSDGLLVTALGTEFNVSSYPEDPFIRTTLISGSVKVKNNDYPDCFLSAGDQFSYHKKTKEQLIAQVDTEDIIAWKRGELVFNGVTITEVLNVLERSHKTTFQYNEGVFNDDKYNFRFRMDVSIADIMDIIQRTSDFFEYKKVGDSYYIDSKQ